MARRYLNNKPDRPADEVWCLGQKSSCRDWGLGKEGARASIQTFRSSPEAHPLPGIGLAATPWHDCRCLLEGRAPQKRTVSSMVGKRAEKGAGALSPYSVPCRPLPLHPFQRLPQRLYLSIQSP